MPAISFISSEPYVGLGLLLFFMICIQANDVLQYVSGNLFGKTSLSPKISPDKTIEGAIGGILATGALAAIIHIVTPFTPLVAAGLGLGIACLGIVGDLLLSAIKRDLDVKDFSNMIPGHFDKPSCQSCKIDDHRCIAWESGLIAPRKSRQSPTLHSIFCRPTPTTLNISFFSRRRLSNVLKYI